MLDLDMDLEGELGIDSIKQVEILSALRERIPDMPEIDPARLAELRTLAQIADAIAGSAPASAVGRTNGATDPASGFSARAAASRLFRQDVRLENRQAPVGPASLAANSLIEITSDDHTLARILADRFSALGYRVQAVGEPSGTADMVVVTAGLNHVLAPSEMHRRALAAARSLARQAGAGGPTGHFIVLQDTGGDFGRRATTFDAAVRGGLTGLAKTASHEWQDAVVRAIDVERSGSGIEDIAGRLLSEILCGDDSVEIGLRRDGSRLVPVAETIAFKGEGYVPRDGDVIVVSGGARGITARIVERLAGMARFKFLLLGRSRPSEWPADIDPDLDTVSRRRTALRVQPSAAAARRRVNPFSSTRRIRGCSGASSSPRKLSASGTLTPGARMSPTLE